MPGDGIACDVLVIGGGVVGCAVLRELSRYDLRLALCDAASDVGQGISRANTAIAHTGFDAPPGSLEARLVTASHRIFPALCAELGVDTRPCGALMVALEPADLPRLDAYEQKAALNGIPVERVGAGALLERWPYLNPMACGGLFIPGETPVDSFALTLGYAEAAARAGASILLDEPVIAIAQGAGELVATTSRRQIRARSIVNAAGLAAARIAGLVGDSSFEIRPRKGQLFVVDPAGAPPIDTILLPTPSPTTKGILVTPAAHGNLLLGPTAEDGVDPSDWSTSAAGLAQVLAGVRRLVPGLVVEQPITQYAGLRSVGYERAGEELVPAEDYIVRPAAGCPRLLHIAGIRSTGLSASPALAAYAVDLLAAQGLELRPRLGRRPAAPPADRRAPDETPIVCRCAMVSAGQVRGAIHAAVPAHTLDALKRRLWAMAGPCQGTLCIAQLIQILAAEHGCDPAEIRKHELGSEVLVRAGEPRTTELQNHPQTEQRTKNKEQPDHRAAPKHQLPATKHQLSSIVHHPLSASYDVVVVGAGPAGAAAAQAAQSAGAAVLLIDLAERAGGALPAMGLGDPVPGGGLEGIDMLYSTALAHRAGSNLTLRGPGGIRQVRAGRLILATGGRELTRGNLAIPGTRPAGVLTAGAALRLLATTGRLPGTCAALIGAGRWAGSVAAHLAAAGVEIAVQANAAAQIDGWPRVSAVVLPDSRRIPCDLAVLATPLAAWLPAGVDRPEIDIGRVALAGAAALGECDAAQAAAHGREVGASLSE